MIQVQHISASARQTADCMETLSSGIRGWTQRQTRVLVNIQKGRFIVCYIFCNGSKFCDIEINSVNSSNEKKI